MKTIVNRSMNGSVAEKVAKPDFGTYHHSTPEESVKIRAKVKRLFLNSFDTLPFSRSEKLKILDIGRGLGFLSCLGAEYYPKARVTGFDTFEHASLKGSSLAKARKNAELLGLSERIVFRKGDVFRSDFHRGRFDLLVSNLVFHNFGRKRVQAYRRLAHWATPRSIVVLGDLFFDYKIDIKKLAEAFHNVKERPGRGLGSMYKLLILQGRTASP